MRRGQSGSTNRAGAQYAPIAAKSVMHAVSRAHTGAVDGVFARSKEARQRLQVGRKNRGLRRFPLFTPQCTSVACGVPASPEEGAWCRARVVGEWARPRQAGALTVRALPRSPEPHHRYPPQFFFWPSAIPVQSRARFAGRAIEGAPRLLHSRRPSRPPLHRRRCPCQRFSFAPAPPSSSPSVR